MRELFLAGGGAKKQQNAGDGEEGGERKKKEKKKGKEAQARDRGKKQTWARLQKTKLRGAGGGRRGG